MYQGRWNAAYRDMEAEIIPMCEDQGMAIIPWAALGGGQLLSTEQRKQKEQDPGARSSRHSLSENDIRVCEVLERMAESKSTTLQAMVCLVITYGSSVSIAD
jgi:aryl-alcohol dehydrogenase-like predicted oxidoreductase